MPQPVKYSTPYGGRLEWTLPGENKLCVHLKDKTKVRHRKRWSQVSQKHNLLVKKNFYIHLSRKLANFDCFCVSTWKY